MYHLFIGFLKEIFRKALLNGFYQHVEDAETPTDHIFFLIFMSAILVNDNFMGTWFRKIPRSLRFGTFIDKVIQELSQPNSLSLLLSRMDAYLRIQHLQEYDKPCRCLTEREISVWKLAILYFFEMFVLESLAGPCFLNIPLTEDLMHELRTYIDRYQIYDPALSMMGYFKRKANKFTNHIKHMMEELEFLKKTNPSARLTGGVRLQRGQKFNFCYFCLKTNCTRCRLCNKHDCGCCKQCETPDSCCKLCRLCSSCSQHDHSECSLKLRNVSRVLFGFVKLVNSMIAIRFLRLKKIGSYCYLCNREEESDYYVKGVLPCGHHFCDECTRRMINPDLKKYQRTVCPLCFTKIGGYRGIIFTTYRVKLCHPLILTTRKLYEARKIISHRLFIRWVIPKRLQMLKDFDKDISEKVCVICRTKFNNPIILPCGHFFCQVCIIQLQSRTNSLPHDGHCQVCINQAHSRQCPLCGKLVVLGCCFKPSNCPVPSTSVVPFIFGTYWQPARPVYLSGGV